MLNCIENDDSSLFCCSIPSAVCYHTRELSICPTWELKMYHCKPDFVHILHIFSLCFCLSLQILIHMHRLPSINAALNFCAALRQADFRSNNNLKTLKQYPHPLLIYAFLFSATINEVKDMETFLHLWGFAKASILILLNVLQLIVSKLFFVIQEEQMLK